VCYSTLVARNAERDKREGANQQNQKDEDADGQGTDVRLTIPTPHHGLPLSSPPARKEQHAAAAACWCRAPKPLAATPAPAASLQRGDSIKGLDVNAPHSAPPCTSEPPRRPRGRKQQSGTPSEADIAAAAAEMRHTAALPVGGTLAAGSSVAGALAADTPVCVTSRPPHVSPLCPPKGPMQQRGWVKAHSPALSPGCSLAVSTRAVRTPRRAQVGSQVAPHTP
jgi:hypothetical protein